MTGYRTALFGAILTVLGALQGLDWITLVSDAKIAGWMASGIGLAVMVLRAITSTPIGETPKA